MCSLKGLNTGLRADAAQGKGCVQEEIFMSRSAKNDKTKTNVMRLLDAAKIPYEAKEYPVDENDLSGSHAADMLGVDHGSVFKTLVLKGERTGFLVCCIPVDGEVDLKKAAKAAGDKKVEMLPMKDLLATTGYIRGGCSPIGMKKKFPTFIDEAALKYETIAVSAGQRGFQVLLSPQALADYVGAKLLDLQQNCLKKRKSYRKPPESGESIFNKIVTFAIFYTCQYHQKFRFYADNIWKRY